MYRYGRRVNVNVNGSHSHIKYIPRSLELKGLYSTRREFEIRDSRNGTENSVGRDLPFDRQSEPHFLACLASR
jgi:hypothetical protein